MHPTFLLIGRGRADILWVIMCRKIYFDLQDRYKNRSAILFSEKNVLISAWLI